MYAFVTDRRSLKLWTCMGPVVMHYLAFVERSGVNPTKVGDILVKIVLAPGSKRAMKCKIACFLVGFPETIFFRTVNRQCSSGLQAMADVAASIKAGVYEIGTDSGVESITNDAMAFGRKV